MGLDMGERKSVNRETAQEYRRGSKKVKLMGCKRHHAGWLLRMWGTTVVERRNGELVRYVVGQRSRRRSVPRIYDQQVVKALQQVWYLFGCMCGKRLLEVLRHQLSTLEKFGEISLDPEARAKLERISAATVDRLLKEHKRTLQVRGRSHTKATTRLMNEIPIRTFTEWRNVGADHMGADLVGHDGGRVGGEMELLNQIYDRVRLLVNFFYPSQKLISKTRQGARVRRLYDAAQTPFQRVLACDEVPEEAKQRLRRQFETLNPAALQRDAVRLQQQLLRLVAERSSPVQRVG